MSEKKITKKEMFAMLLEVEGVRDNAMYVDFINKQIASLEKKSSAHKETATQKANRVLKANIYAFMEVGKTYSISNLIDSVEGLAGLSNQKVSALMKQLVDEGFAKRISEKRATVFAKVEN